MSWVDIVNLSGSIVSIILAAIAIILSFYFYNQSKDTEKEVAKSLCSIETQSEMLQKLTARWMDRLTKYATDARPYEETINQLCLTIQEIPKTITGTSQLPQAQEQLEALTKDAVAGFVGLYYYSYLSNVYLQGYLPVSSEFDSDNEFHNIIKMTIDQSYNDFSYVKGVLDNTEHEKIDNNPLKSYYEAVEVEKVKDSGQVFIDKENDENMSS
jgi:uncharacterized protein YoxC